MPTIVEYTDRKKPRSYYPQFIISPTHVSGCCKDNMVEIGKGKEARMIKEGLYYGEVINTGEVEFGYFRCRVCGFTVRRFPQGALMVVAESIEDLQRVFSNKGLQMVSDDNPGSF